MHTGEDDQSNWEVCFTVSPVKGTDQITYVKPDDIFHGNVSEGVKFNVKANSVEDAEEKSYNMLTDPRSPYVKKYGPGFEVKKKYIWRIY
jgi:hypothetical protein